MSAAFATGWEVGQAAETDLTTWEIVFAVEQRSGPLDHRDKDAAVQGFLDGRRGDRWRLDLSNGQGDLFDWPPMPRP